jgi:RNA polymerase sigma-70 factor (ECF subfamily)
MIRRLGSKKKKTDDPSAVTDEQLMDRLKAGHRPAGGILFDRYHVKLYQFFWRMCQDRSLSEDLTQVTFERLLRYRSSYQSGQSVRTWLYQIARHAAYDHFKKNKLRISDFTKADDLGQADPNHRLEDADQQAQLREAMKQLRPELREVLILTRYQGMRYQEAAQILDCSEGAVKVRVHRAIKELRTVFFNLENQSS